MEFFSSFDLFFGIVVVRPLNFNDIFAATDGTTYLLKVRINIFLKQLFADDL